jgi:hypothetical protein
MAIALLLGAVSCQAGFDHPRTPLDVREHAHSVSGNPGFSRKEPEELGCLILILTRASKDLPHYSNQKKIGKIRELGK